MGQNWSKTNKNLNQYYNDINGSPWANQGSLKSRFSKIENLRSAQLSSDREIAITGTGSNDI